MRKITCWKFFCKKILFFTFLLVLYWGQSFASEHKRIVFIHMAPPKCGNTFLQRVLLDNKKRLSEIGVFYLQKEDYFYGAVGKYFAELYEGKNPDPHPAKQEIIRVLKALPAHGSVIISNECFIGLSYNDLQQPNIHVLRKKGCLKFFKEVSDELGYEIIPIFYIKAQDKFLESNYTQLVAEQGTLSFDDWMCAIDPAQIEWRPLIEDLNSVYGGKVVIKAFEEIYAGREAFVRAFIEEIKRYDRNIPRSFKLEIKKSGVYDSNLSYSGLGISIVRFLNKHLSKKKMKRMRPFLQTVLSKKYFPGVCLFNKPFRVFLKRHYLPSNLYLLEKYALNKYKKYYMPLCN